MRTSEQTNEINKSLIEAIPEIENLFPSAKGYGYDYIPLEDIINEIKPKLKKYGLAVIQLPVCPEILDHDNDRVGVETRVIHESGQWIEQSVFAKLTELSKGSNTQRLGATITYLRRYGLASIFGIAADVDIDAAFKEEKKIENILKKKTDEFLKIGNEVKEKMIPIDKNNFNNLVSAINAGKADYKRVNDALIYLRKTYNVK